MPPGKYNLNLISVVLKLKFNKAIGRVDGTNFLTSLKYITIDVCCLLLSVFMRSNLCIVECFNFLRGSGGKVPIHIAKKRRRNINSDSGLQGFTLHKHKARLGSQPPCGNCLLKSTYKGGLREGRRLEVRGIVDCNNFHNLIVPIRKWKDWVLFGITIIIFWFLSRFDYMEPPRPDIDVIRDSRTPLWNMTSFFEAFRPILAS